MSTFDGVIHEIPSISVDKFDGVNINSKIFFLSHCHMDHMSGLDNVDGINGPLYLSSVSAVIVSKQFVKVKQLVVLGNNVPTPITYVDNRGTLQHITVTTLPAFHCPGSVMFLFEKGNSRVLYTGDFRVSMRYVQKMKALRDPSSGLPIAIDKIYIDSTFLSKLYLNFPDQFDSMIKICDLIEEWLGQNSRHVISLKMPARYGYEWLFERIAERTNRKIHVNESELAKYKHIPELDNIFTTVSHNSHIHACFDWQNKNGKNLTCNPQINPSFIRVIKPSAFVWKEWNESLSLVKREPNEFVRVCYSNHCSFTEIFDFLKFLKPKSVELNVIPHEPLKKTEMINDLTEIMEIVGIAEDVSTKCEKVEADPELSLNWDNLSKISKLKLKANSKTEDELLICPPKRHKF